MTTPQPPNYLPPHYAFLGCYYANCDLISWSPESRGCPLTSTYFAPVGPGSPDDDEDCQDVVI